MKTLLAAAALLLAATPAAAQVTGFASVTSNYMSRGTEQNMYHHPAVQAGATVTSKSGYYASVLASTMNFGEKDWGTADKNTTRELDFFVGKKTQVGKTTLDIGAASINYPGNRVPLNFVEYDVKVDRPLGKGSVGAWVGYTDHYFATYGKGIWTEVHGSYPLSAKLSVSGSAANQNLKNDFDYRTWNVGATYAVRPDVLVDVRFSDTDRHDLDPLFNTYGARTSVTVTKTF